MLAVLGLVEGHWPCMRRVPRAARTHSAMEDLLLQEERAQGQWKQGLGLKTWRLAGSWKVETGGQSSPREWQLSSACSKQNLRVLLYGLSTEQQEAVEFYHLRLQQSCHI